MQTPPLSDRLRYAIDNAFSKGTIVLIGWLGIITAIIIFSVALFLWLFQAAPGYSIAQLSWMGLMRAMDSGAIGGDEGSWIYLTAMMVVTVTGIFVLSILIGILTTGIESKLESLRKGRSRVIEQGHTVILGWSQQIYTVISELVEANSNKKDSCIVVLGPADKVEMEEAIQQRVPDTGRTRIVCRTGNPIEMADLEIANLAMARSIIILAPEQDDPDAEVIKTMLAITNAPGRRQEPYHVVAELRDPRNLDVARMAGRGEVEVVLAGDLIARLIAQTCRQSGLSAVYMDLLTFAGNELYIHEEPALAGKTVREALLSYETSCVIGVQPAGQKPVVLPPLDTAIKAGDKIIVVAEDDDKIVLAPPGRAAVSEELIRISPPQPSKPERALILGWNWRAPAIINELDQYVAAGSHVTVVADYAEAEAQLQLECSGLRRQSVQFIAGDTTDRRLLDSLDIGSYDHVVALSYSDLLDVQQADSRTLITLLHLRDIASRQGSRTSIVTEMLDVRNRNLAEVAQADDYIVSDRLISLLLAQVSENKALNDVLADIFDAEGAEIYLKPARDYVVTDKPVNFYTAVEAAARRNEIAIGYRREELSGDIQHNYGVVLNPNKAAELSFGHDDMLVVIATD